MEFADLECERQLLLMLAGALLDSLARASLTQAPSHSIAVFVGNQ